MLQYIILPDRKLKFFDVFHYLWEKYFNIRKTIKQENMKHLLQMAAIATLFLGSCCAEKTEINLIPQPQEITEGNGSFKIDENTAVKGNATFAVNFLKDMLKGATNRSLIENDQAAENYIEIKIDTLSGIEKEGYKLSVTAENVVITASDKAGAFYGVQTLLQLLPATVYGNATGAEKWVVPAVEINDYPRFGYRGAGLDVSRTFFPLETIYKMLDWISAHKINTFHWHLTDDNGWRIEIKKYPLLTEKGAWRGPDEILPPSYGSGNKRYGGFYTQDEIKEVVKYAADRNITIVPEIDLPGHSKAVIETYPQVGCKNLNKTMSVNGEVNNIWCVGNEKTYEMIDNIVAELAELFPGKMMHLGGDEVNFDNWKNCPVCQSFMRRHGMKKEVELQYYFVRRMEKIVAKYGKVLVGWDEIIRGKELEPTTVVYGWGSINRCANAVKKGQPTVFIPAQYCYMDMKQSEYERGHDWAAIVPLDSTYKLDPINMNSFTPEEEKNVLGVQVNLWCELLDRPARFLEYQFFPRLCAISEVGWTNPELKDYNNFYGRLTHTHYDRLQNMGIQFRLPFPEVVYEEGILKVTKPYDGAVIRYTTDATEPTAESPVYTKEIKTDSPKKYRFATFYSNTHKSITVGASNIELYDYIQPEVSIESSYKESETNKSFPMSNITNYNYKKYWRINRRSNAGDYVQYTFKEPVECSKITVETGIPGITFYTITEGYIEYSYNGTDFIKGDELVYGIATIIPTDKVKAVRVVATGMSDALITAFQNLRIEK